MKKSWFQWAPTSKYQEFTAGINLSCLRLVILGSVISQTSASSKCSALQTFLFIIIGMGAICYHFCLGTGIFFSCTKTWCIISELRTKEEDDHAQKHHYSQKREIRSLKSRDPEETRRKSLRRIEFPFLRVILNAPN